MTKLLKKLFTGGKFLLLATGLATSLLTAALYVAQPGILRFLDYKIYDQHLRRNHSTKTSGIPVIVDIDEKSLAALGQWPWPRYRVALLLEKIRQAGALAVGMDVVLAEPDRTSPALLQRQIKKELMVDVQFQGLPKALEDHDALLASVLASKPYVLGFYFSFSKAEADQQKQDGDCLIKPAQVAVLSAPGALPPEQALHSAFGAVCPLPVLAGAASSTGFFNATPDPDGILRRVALLINYQGQLYPSLALATLMQATGDPGIMLKLDTQGAESLRYAGSVIPVDRAGQMLVNYRGGGGAFPYISAVDIMDGKADPALLNGKIAFVGTSAAGLKDLRATPFTAVYPGVETHATILDNILTQDFISIPDYAPAVELAATLFSGILITLLVTWARAVWIVVPLVGMAFGMWEGTSYLMSSMRVYISPLYSYIILGANFALLTLIKFWREEKQKKFIHGAFSHYLAPAVIKQIYDSPESLSLQGQEKEVTVMFSDVRGFTTMSEKLTPTQVTDLLHDYLTPMTRVITGNMGTLDKFIGDAIMAFWNAPLDVPEHQKKAVDSALQMLKHLEDLNEGFKQKFGLTIKIGVGLHCGRVRVGNMGSADLFDYTLIGDNVNLTSRLEGLTKYYGQTLLISEAMREACGDAYSYLEMDSVRVKGKHEPITIYTAMPHEQAAARAEEIAKHNEALALYKAMRFAEAEAAFDELMASTGNEALYTMYAERCRTLAEHRPAEGWDGVYTHTSK
ncbi:MAG TPA: adenylate/guanylate cyclase domain-containing protein [Humidesulfovibrio sp.]|uniref:CHASE2 domain-containing protein n=1 Tax=Humidesulfovibrio sp. TaxID=2910988 RepID=UPI002C79BD69|nr:adenylate/guanylate cyclase domain-containing protein [Humidesulfovibrio sp.]HWR04851.1 adenylate/guanylate cyclase domain-containing protein [Humidesulfovibrio sp.]